jgi:hypothetical protein
MGMCGVAPSWINMGHCRSYSIAHKHDPVRRKAISQSNIKLMRETSEPLWERPSAQIGVEVMSYCVLEVRIIRITYFTSMQCCEMLQEYLSLEAYNTIQFVFNAHKSAVCLANCAACSEFCNICLTNLCLFSKESRTCPLSVR